MGAGFHGVEDSRLARPAVFGRRAQSLRRAPYTAHDAGRRSAQADVPRLYRGIRHRVVFSAADPARAHRCAQAHFP